MSKDIEARIDRLERVVTRGFSVNLAEYDDEEQAKAREKQDEADAKDAEKQAEKAAKDA